jgi:hypothetical protein
VRKADLLSNNTMQRKKCEGMVIEQQKGIEYVKEHAQRRGGHFIDVVGRSLGRPSKRCQAASVASDQVVPVRAV